MTPTLKQDGLFDDDLPSALLSRPCHKCSCYNCIYRYKCPICSVYEPDKKCIYRPLYLYHEPCKQKATFESNESIPCPNCQCGNCSHIKAGLEYNSACTKYCAKCGLSSFFLFEQLNASTCYFYMPIAQGADNDIDI